MSKQITRITLRSKRMPIAYSSKSHTDGRSLLMLIEDFAIRRFVFDSLWMLVAGIELTKPDLLKRDAAYTYNKMPEIELLGQLEGADYVLRRIFRSHTPWDDQEELTGLIKDAVESLILDSGEQEPEIVRPSVTWTTEKVIQQNGIALSPANSGLPLIILEPEIMPDEFVGEMLEYDGQVVCVSKSFTHPNFVEIKERVEGDDKPY